MPATRKDLQRTLEGNVSVAQLAKVLADFPVKWCLMVAKMSIFTRKL